MYSVRFGVCLSALRNSLFVQLKEKTLKNAIYPHKHSSKANESHANNQSSLRTKVGQRGFRVICVPSL